MPVRMTNFVCEINNFLINSLYKKRDTNPSQPQISTFELWPHIPPNDISFRGLASRELNFMESETTFLILKPPKFDIFVTTNPNFTVKTKPNFHSQAQLNFTKFAHIDTILCCWS